jgi:hypothetical protein
LIEFGSFLLDLRPSLPGAFTGLSPHLDKIVGFYSTHVWAIRNFVQWWKEKFGVPLTLEMKIENVLPAVCSHKPMNCVAAVERLKSKIGDDMPAGNLAKMICKCNQEIGGNASAGHHPCHQPTMNEPFAVSKLVASLACILDVARLMIEAKKKLDLIFHQKLVAILWSRVHGARDLLSHHTIAIILALTGTAGEHHCSCSYVWKWKCCPCLINFSLILKLRLLPQLLLEQGRRPSLNESTV